MDDKTKNIDQELDKTSENREASTSDEIIPEEILKAFPEEDRGKVASIIKQTMISGVMRRSNPIADKVTTEHITQIISKSDEQDKRDREERKGERNYNLILIFIALLFIVFLIVFLQGNDELLIKIMISIISFLGGFGFGHSRKKKDN